MVTNSGLQCDVCGKYILPIINDSAVSFHINGIESELHCHQGRCRENVEYSLESKNWRSLPHGPLRQAFESAA